jgi:hypothetical protein
MASCGPRKPNSRLSSRRRPASPPLMAPNVQSDLSSWLNKPASYHKPRTYKPPYSPPRLVQLPLDGCEAHARRVYYALHRKSTSRRTLSHSGNASWRIDGFANALTSPFLALLALLPLWPSSYRQLSRLQAFRQSSSLKSSRIWICKMLCVCGSLAGESTTFVMSILLSLAPSSS